MSEEKDKWHGLIASEKPAPAKKRARKNRKGENKRKEEKRKKQWLHWREGLNGVNR